MIIGESKKVNRGLRKTEMRSKTRRKLKEKRDKENKREREREGCEREG